MNANNGYGEYLDAYMERAEELFESGDFQGAINDYTKVLKLSPNFCFAYLNRGAARYRLGDDLGAIDDFTQAIRLTPKIFWFVKARALEGRGEARYQLGDYTGAIADTHQAKHCCQP